VTGVGVQPQSGNPEYTAADALLPVLTAANPRSLLASREAMTRVRENDSQWTRRRNRALMRANHFNSEASRGRRLRVIESRAADR
jgi:hypothetical protein